MTELAIVTGATGWLGSRLVSELAAEGQKVRAFVQSDQDDSALRALPNVEIRRGILERANDVEALVEGAQGAALFHTAGVIHPHAVREFYTVNVDGTVRLLGAAARAGIRRAVVVSSNSPLGVARTNDVVFDERSPYRPYMNYGRSKMLMEQAVATFQARNLLETVLIRPPWFYGPNQPARQTLFFRLIRDGRFPLVGDGTNRRSMAYIDNLVQGLRLAMRVPEANGQTFWIADERPYTMSEIVTTVRGLLRDEFHERVSEKTPQLPWIAGEIATAADGALQRAGIYQQKIHVLSEMNKTIACSIEAAQRVLGYRPGIALEEGMRRSLRWIYERGGLNG